MQELTIRGPISSVTETRSRGRQNREPARWTTTIHVLETVRLWIARHRQRTALAELAERDDRLLDDIGVSQADAAREAAKPFWH